VPQRKRQLRKLSEHGKKKSLLDTHGVPGGKGRGFGGKKRDGSAVGRSQLQKKRGGKKKKSQKVPRPRGGFSAARWAFLTVRKKGGERKKGEYPW